MSVTNLMRKAGFAEDFIEHTLSINDGEIFYNSGNVDIHDIEDVESLQNFMKLISKTHKNFESTLNFRVRVEVLDLSECDLNYISIKWIGNNIGKIIFGKGVQSIHLSNILSLKELDLKGLEELFEISIEDIKDLKSINIESNNNLQSLGIYNCKNLIELKLADEYEHLDSFISRNNGIIPDYNKVDDLFVLKNLNKDSDKRGTASIMDTGLFDFKIKN